MIVIATEFQTHFQTSAVDSIRGLLSGKVPLDIDKKSIIEMRLSEQENYV